MNGVFWQLPGPSLFLEQIEKSLRAGRNVVIALPEHGPVDLRPAVADRVARADLHTWHPIDVSGADLQALSPAALVGLQCTPAPRPATVKDLVGHERLGGMAIWVEGLQPARWEAWRDFLEEYSDLCRSRAAHERAVFCVPMRGAPQWSLPREDVACAVHRWRGVIRRVDMLLLFYQLLANRTLSPMCSEVWAAVGTELAGTDAELAVRLADAGMDVVLQPSVLLREIARARGWDTKRDGEPAVWERGQEDSVDGRARVHSAWAVLEERGEAEIQRRIWRAQVGVLFPYLEEQRTELLSRIERFLTVPHVTPFGTITDIYDFELSHLLYFARKNPVSEGIRSRLQRLTLVRHHLAHLEAVPLSLLVELDVSLRGA